MKKMRIAALFLALLVLPTASFAAEMDASLIEDWLVRFCQALPSVPLMGDPQDTQDPSRPGEVLLEYEFGTVTAKAASGVAPEDIVQIDVRTAQVTDCRGIRVGAPLDDVLSGRRVDRNNTQLYVLSTQDAGYGFSWAYLDDQGVYGVEHIAYGGEGADVREYTLTYVIDGAQQVSAIRVRCAQATLAQAQQAMNTAEEIALRQQGEVYAVKNDEQALSGEEYTVMGIPVLGMQVADLIGLLGEPVEIQAISGRGGRLLLYEGAAIELALDEMTGEEIVLGVSVSAPHIWGPRGLETGMSVQEAASLYACEADVHAVGGTLYANGAQAGKAPYAELVRSDLGGEATLRYLAEAAGGRTAALEISVQDAVVRNWHVYIVREAGYSGI